MYVISHTWYCYGSVLGAGGSTQVEGESCHFEFPQLTRGDRECHLVCGPRIKGQARQGQGISYSRHLCSLTSASGASFSLWREAPQKSNTCQSEGKLKWVGQSQLHCHRLCENILALLSEFLFSLYV